MPWTVKRSNQSIQKEINHEYSWKNWCWSWSSNTLATWYRVNSLEKNLMLGKIERRRRGRQRMRWLDGIINSMDMNEFEQTLGDSEGQGSLVCNSPWDPKSKVRLDLLNEQEVKSNSFVTPWTAACQAPLSMGSPRQEYWSKLPFPSPGDLPDPGVEPGSPTSLLCCRQILYHCTTWETIQHSNNVSDY